jgi:hypothetical protein
VKVVLAFVALPRKLVKARKCFQEGFLAGVFGVSAIAGQAESPTVESRAEWQDHLGKRFAIAHSRICEYLALGGAQVLSIFRIKIVGV